MRGPAAAARPGECRNRMAVAAETLHRFRPERRRGLVLPRLVASGADWIIAREPGMAKAFCSRGRRDATQPGDEMRRNPAVVHFATHVLESPERPASA